MDFLDHIQNLILWIHDPRRFFTTDPEREKTASGNLKHSVIHTALRTVTPGGEGGTPLYKPYRYVPPHRVGVLLRFGLKTGIHFAHFSLESSMVFEGTTEVGLESGMVFEGVYDRIYRFNSR